MRNTSWALCAAGVLLCGAGRLWSGDESAARALVDRAIEAQGGEANLAKFQAVTLKGKGKFYGTSDDGVPFTGEWATQGETHTRMRLEFTAMGQTFKYAKVISGDKGWIKLNDDNAQPMSKEVLAEEREQLHGSWVATLLPLKGKEFKLSPLGEVKVGDRPAVGVRVSRQGRRDVSLYFDQKSHLLVKTAMTVKQVEDG